MGVNRPKKLAPLPGEKDFFVHYNQYGRFAVAQDLS
jgi:hypothetical protein